ncbi:MAG: hypothetical protein KKH98_14090, partial [Spirochaetes bacterium]|nr:hypothetical protein [Spirochaetota bacterium]
MMKQKIKILLISSVILCLSTVNLSGAGGYATGGLTTPNPQYITGSLSAPLPFADWWTSIMIMQNCQLLAVFPLYFKVINNTGENWGLGVQYPGPGTFVDNAHTDSVLATPFTPDMYMRAQGWNGNNLTTRADGYSDWTVKMHITDGSSAVNYVTLVKGSPFFYIETQNTPKEEVYFTSPITNTFTTNSAFAGLSTTNPVTNDHLAFSTASRHYAIFSSPGTVFKMINNNKVYVSNYNNYLSVAILSNKNDLTTFYESAYAFISDSAVSYVFNEALSEITITYTVTTTLKRGGFSDVPIIGLLYHHYKFSSAVCLSTVYPTIRGPLKILKGKTFNTIHKFEGILPFFTEPVAPGYNRAALQGYVTTIKNAITNNGFNKGDTYWAGKSLARAAKVIPIANEIGDTTSRESLKTLLKNELIEWYNTGGPTYYVYMPNWGTMIGVPTGFGTDTGLNDHHFHHGYFIYSSAILAMFDATFITDYGWLVERLIRDVSSPNRADGEFAFMNYLDIYEGHSWASGIAQFNDGNNQESSSEAMNYWAGVYLWGLITGNNTYRDLGIFGYVLENSANNSYWFDIEKEVFHPSYSAQNTMTCLVWGGKYDHNTWFGSEQEYIHGIIWLPVTPSSMYLNYHPWYARANYNDMVAKNGGPEDRWYDVIWKYQSMFDPEGAIIKFNNNPALIAGVDYDAGAGNSVAEIYNFLYNMKGGGEIDTNYYADHSSYNVFTNNMGSSNDVTYMAFNPTGAFKTVHFYKNAILEYTMTNIPAYRVWSSKMTAPTNWPPVADFSITNVDQLTKIFNATISYDLEGNTLYYAWDFNGDAIADLGFSSNRAIVTNVYGTYGTNYVTLWVTDLLGGTNSIAKLCYRTPPPQPEPPPVIPPEVFPIPISINIEKSIIYPNPMHMSRDDEIKFSVYEEKTIKGYPADTEVIIYDISGNTVWESEEAMNYEYNIIRCRKNIFEEKGLKNEVLIAVIKNS